MAEASLKKLRQAGMVPMKVLVATEEFAHWCRESGLEPDGAARAAYSSHLMRTGKVLPMWPQK